MKWLKNAIIRAKTDLGHCNIATSWDAISLHLGCNLATSRAQQNYFARIELHLCISLIWIYHIHFAGSSNPNFSNNPLLQTLALCYGTEHNQIVNPNLSGLTGVQTLYLTGCNSSIGALDLHNNTQLITLFGSGSGVSSLNLSQSRWRWHKHSQIGMA